MELLKAIKKGQNCSRLFNLILYASSKVKKENDAIRNRIADDFDKRRISQPKILLKNSH